MKKDRSLGAIPTPKEIARFLVKWAIRCKDDLVLDPGAGEGIFVNESIRRLNELNCTVSKSLNQVFAIEYDNEAFNKLVTSMQNKYATVVDHNMVNSNFFDVWPDMGKVVFPKVDAVVGNPPYVERQLITNSDQIRNLLARRSNVKLNGSTDIYGYFIIHATDFLKPNGRLAFIVSDTWMNMDFGVAIRDFLLKKFRIKAIIGFDRRVFPKVLVRTVMLLLERKNDEELKENQVSFVQLSDLARLDELSKDMESLSKERDGNGFRVALTKQVKLSPSIPWTIYLKSPKVYFRSINHPLMTSLSDIARSSIGVQTLKRNFFVMEESKRKRSGLESRYFERIVLSPREAGLVIDNREQVPHSVLYCDKEKHDLSGTKLLRYIEQAEQTKVKPRGKSETYLGFHKIPRIQKAHRKPWYNIKSEIDRRCQGPILIPRRIYERYTVVWNKLLLPVNEDFIVVEPKDSRMILPLLAILNSSLTEFFVRVLGHIYGGGVCDLRPDDVKNLPVMNVRALDEEALRRLEQAYQVFLSSNGTNRGGIDDVIQSILNLPEKLQRDISKDYKQILEVSLMAKKN